MQNEPAIVIDNVSKKFKTNSGFLKTQTKQALDQVTLTIPKGSVFGFLGPNGAGKTTLIKTIVGLLTPDKGFCQIYGHDPITNQPLTFDSLTPQAKLRLGYLPERPYYHEFLNSEEFLHFHGRLLGLTYDEVETKIPDVLKRVGLTHARKQKLKTFSKGMLQRIGFAQALIHDPDILILDEPMSGLDPVGRREVRDIILEIAAMGKTIFFSTHIIHDVEVICTTVGYIRNGQLQGSGTIEQLLGKTIKSMEVRFSLPEKEDASRIRLLHDAKRTMDGWVLDFEADVESIEDELQEVLKKIIQQDGKIKSVISRKSTLEDLFFAESQAK